MKAVLTVDRRVILLVSLAIALAAVALMLASGGGAPHDSAASMVEYAL
jgi:hypothetical protein